MEDYQVVFDLRGSRYDQAMGKHPSVRDEEFGQIISRACLEATDIVADVPAGGGYLKAYLPDGCQWLGHEPCSSFSHESKPPKHEQLLPLPWSDSSIDVVMSLAGVHHIEDKRPLFVEIERVIKPSGKFILSDVAADSPVAYFLDDYVGKYNSTGHVGVYLDQTTLNELTESSWLIDSSEQVDFLWKFTDLEEMEIFCNELFDIRKAKKGQTIRVIEDLLSIIELPGGGCGMNWSLMTIVSKTEKRL